MKVTKYFKSVVAGITAAAMAVTMLPTAGLGVVKAALSTDNAMILHLDMTKDADGKLKDLTNNGHLGVINGTAETKNIDNIDVLDMKGGYVDIPDGTVGTSDTELTINMLVKISENIPASWMWCLGSSNKRYLYFTGCCSSSQGSKMRGGAGCVPDTDGDGKPDGNGWSFESVINGDSALETNEWQNITVTYKDGGEFIFYKNGELQASTQLSEGAAGDFTLQDLMTAGDDRDGYMGWSFYTGADPKFLGNVADFRIYNHAMTATEVTELASDIDSMLEALKNSDFTQEDIQLTEEDCLGGNTSKDAVTADLSLPSTTKVTLAGMQKDAQIVWESSNSSVIGNDGKVTPALKDQTVTMTANVTLNGNTVKKELIFKVPGNGTEEGFAKADADALTIFTQNDIRGNITLDTKGRYGSDITWESSDEDIISTQADGDVPAGVVNRPSKDTEVTLTATVTYGGATEQKKFECTVKKAAATTETTDYLFAYFPYTSTKDERIYFGISEDGLNFTALNDSKFVLESTLGTHGLRDPFIIRSHEGDKFYLIATDLTVAGLTQDGTKYPGMSWDKNQTEGSQSIMVWESTDLVNWSAQRECKIAADNAGCTWAPEAYWDDETQQYMVFWASKTGDDNYGKQRVYCAMTRDFYNFSEPQVWIEEDGSVIDTTVMKVGEYYYRYTKNEAGSANKYGTPSKRVYCERSKSLTSGNWERVHENSLDISGGQIEGACIYELNHDDVQNAQTIAALKGFTLSGEHVYSLIADKTGVTIFPGLSDDITAGNFHVLGTTKGAEVNGTKLYTMPEPDASHGTIMPITSEEYNNLMLKYDAAYRTAAAEYVAKADAAAEALALSDAPVTGDIKLPASADDGVAVTWESSNDSIIHVDGTNGIVKRPEYAEGDAVVELTATITVKGNGTVRDQIRRKSFTVTVTKKDTGIILEDVELCAGKTAELTAKVVPESASEVWTSWDWKSDDTSVAEVTGSGKNATVTAKAKGKAVINLVAKDQDGNNEVKASCNVTVKVAPASIKLSSATLSLNTTTNKTAVLTATVLPEDADNKDVKWQSGNPTVVEVDDSGNVTAKAAGTAKIIVTAEEKDADGKEVAASCEVTVTDLTQLPVVQNYTVTFNSDGGSAVAAQTVKSGETAVAPKNPTKSNYLFAGWELDAKKYDFNTKVTGNITLKAKWTLVKVGTSKVSAAKVKKTKCTVTAKKVSGAKGYRFAYTTDKKFKKKIKYTKPGSSVKATLKLKKGTYYVKAQAYKLDSTGKKVYGKLSKAKKVVIRKK